MSRGERGARANERGDKGNKGNKDDKGNHGGRGDKGDRGDQPASGAEAGAFLRALAERAEHDAALAAHINEALVESGLVQPAQPPGKRPRRAAASAPADAAASPPATPPDPFALLRQHGVDGLRAALDALDLATLRQIVRANRLDPARISARWTARDRLVALIVQQVQARANIGRAFERI